MPSAMLAAHRTSATAPAYIHCDITRDATIPISTGLDFFTREYKWDFGDGDAETFATSGQSSNIMYGPVAGHVYREAGTYTVTLTVAVCGAAGVTPTVYKFTQQITVSAFAGTELYVDAAAADDTGDGLTPETAKQTLDAGLTLLFAANGPRRLNLAVDGTYSYTTARNTETRTGFFMLGSYGTGAKPIINNSSGNAIVRPTNSTDWEWVQSNLQIDCTNTNTHGFRPGHNCLCIDCDINTPYWGVYADENALHQSYDNASTGVSYLHTSNNCVWNTTITSAAQYGMYWDHGKNASIIGTTITNVTTEHGIRCYLTHSVISHCLFAGTYASGKHALKVVGYFPTGDSNRHGSESTEEGEYNVYSDNICDDLACNWNIVVGPVDEGKDQRHQYVTVDRNLVRCTVSSSQVGIYLNNHYTAARNNVITANNTPSGTVTGVRVTRRGIEPAATDIIVAHTTGYRSVSGAMRTVQVTSASNGDVLVVYCYGNIAQSPSSADAVNATAAGAAATVTESPTASSAVQGTNLSMTDPANEDFTLQIGSACIGAAVVTPWVYRDGLVKIRTRTTNFDAGARTVATSAEADETPLVTTRTLGAGRIGVVAARGRRGR